MRVVAKIGTSSITDDRGVDRPRRRSPSCAARSPRCAPTATRSSSCRRARSRPVCRRSGCRPPDRHADPAGDRGRGAEPADRGVQPRARPARPRRRARCCSTRTTSSTARQYLHARQTLDAAARARVRADRQRERRHRRRRDPLRRQRPPRRAGRQLRRRRPAGAAHRHRRAVHRRSARATRRRTLDREVARRRSAAGDRGRRSGSGRGSGGMAIEAGRGTDRVVVGRAHRDRRAPTGPTCSPARVAGEPRSARRSTPHDRRLPARKLWIAFAAEVERDDRRRRRRRARARRAGTSLLPAGVRRGHGRFDAGDTVEIVGPDGRRVRRGHGRRRRADAPRASPAGARATCPPDVPHEVVHRDDLVVLPSSAADGRLVRGRSDRCCDARRRRRVVSRRRAASRPSSARSSAEAALRLDVRRGLLDLEHRGSRRVSLSSPCALAFA